MLCEFCLASIPFERLESRRLAGGRLKYCSELCNKRASYMRRTRPKKHSIFFNNPQPGIVWENWFIKKYDAVRPSRSLNTPFDFWYEGKRADLKAVNVYRRGGGAWWPFVPGTRRSEVDIFICLGLIDNKLAKVFIIPEPEFPKGGASMGVKKSKWDKYLVVL